MYADDCQLYTTCDAADVDQSIHSMERLIGDIRHWYTQNMLKLNYSKTELLVITSKFREGVLNKSIRIGDSTISSAPSIRNLGVFMDPNYTMVPHVNHLVCAAFLKIREISYYRRYLTKESAKSAVHAYITSRLDYCNSLFLEHIRHAVGHFTTRKHTKLYETGSSTYFLFFSVDPPFMGPGCSTQATKSNTGIS